jgi:hypothetical protein
MSYFYACAVCDVYTNLQHLIGYPDNAFREFFNFMLN